MMGNVSLPPDYSLSDLERLNNDSAYYSGAVSFTNLREQALQEAAQALGTQGGLNYESQQIDDILNQNADKLYQIFDFNQVVYADNVLPPVLNTANNLVNINDTGDTIRIAGTTYTILSPARFVTAPPTWRDYLWQNYPVPDLPDKSLLPQNSQEQAVWQQNIVQGWQEGINQAVSIFTINLNRLVQDFNGMILYKQLLVQNMVSPYAVDRTEMGITGDGEHMDIDDQTLQITTQPQLLPNSSNRWQVAPVSEQSSQDADTTQNNTNSNTSADTTSNEASNLMNALEKAVDNGSKPVPATQ